MSAEERDERGMCWAPWCPRDAERIISEIEPRGETREKCLPNLFPPHSMLFECGEIAGPLRNSVPEEDCGAEPGLNLRLIAPVKCRLSLRHGTGSSKNGPRGFVSTLTNPPLTIYLSTRPFPENSEHTHLASWHARTQPNKCSRRHLEEACALKKTLGDRRLNSPLLFHIMAARSVASLRRSLLDQHIAPRAPLAGDARKPAKMPAPPTPQA